MSTKHTTFMIICFHIKLTIVTLFFLFLIVTFAAYPNDSNDILTARKTSMKKLASNLKILSRINRRLVLFDLIKVKAVLIEIKENSQSIPELFEIKAADLTSEAASEIWENFGDFTQKATNLENLAQEFAASVEDNDNLNERIIGLRESCKSCHSV